MRVVVPQRGSNMRRRPRLGFLQRLRHTREVQPLADERTVIREILLCLVQRVLEGTDLALRRGQVGWCLGVCGGVLVIGPVVAELQFCRGVVSRKEKEGGKGGKRFDCNKLTLSC